MGAAPPVATPKTADVESMNHRRTTGIGLRIERGGGPAPSLPAPAFAPETRVSGDGASAHLSKMIGWLCRSPPAFNVRK